MKIRVAGVQLDLVLGDKDENLRRMAASLRETAAGGARLTVFPECTLAGYCFESLEEARPHAEPVPGPATDRVSGLCRELGVHAVFGLLEADGTRVFNACVLVGPEGVVGVYRKIHLPFLGVDRFTTPGDRPFAVHQAGELRVGMSICYDGAFPEAARVMALAGADLIVLPTNWPPGAQCTAQCLSNARALENHVYYLAVDRVGIERGFRFIGQSRFCEPSGRVMAEAAHDGPAVIYGDVDPELARNKHVIRVPGKHEIHRFADRRPEMYGPIVGASALAARMLEPEVMDSQDEARDYDSMDHSQVNRCFVEDFLRSGTLQGEILDMGTGTALIPIELCRRSAAAQVLGIDLAASMLDLARANITLANLTTRIRLALVDAKRLPFRDGEFAAVISNSIVHHVPEPRSVLSEAVRVASPGGMLFFRDLVRPSDEATLRHRVRTYAGSSNARQQQMFEASLRAALTLEEIRDLVAELGFPRTTVSATSDRHWTWIGIKS